MAEFRVGKAASPVGASCYPALQEPLRPLLGVPPLPRLEDDSVSILMHTLQADTQP